MPEENFGDRTEEATPRRREEAREEGRVARSSELTSAASLLAAVLLMGWFGGDAFDATLVLMQSLERAGDVRVETLPTTTLHAWTSAALAAAPIVLVLVAVTAAVSLAQSGLMLIWKKLEFKPAHLDPIAGTKRLFSADALTRLLQGLAKVALVSFVAWVTIRAWIERVLASGAAPPGGMFALGSTLILDLAMRLAVMLLIFGIVDYLLQRWRLERQLRMTKQEVRDELKRMEGDPLIKQRRRQIQQRLAMQRLRTEVPKADVIVTNPTEYAVALRYDQNGDAAPRVVAKGADWLAAQIRRLAQQHGVPIVQRPPLARALYAAVEVGREVPPAYYRAVAEVLAYVYQLARRAS